ncbi:uncharacterized protein M437DRAFT_63092 [Aureobasidium melanogenum CBS 110374]|uniref:F-box domain-containing protein n=1 Tax=Aureobasidium melanogenum (strain CBS 110374) TaxID=1043003 RepID=A0A074WAH3_AURM1|nr:uncharacterized protein M437DRAFT_63092 [Aureobasidium melanogenum CBS 110374]KEQ66927.1 hypothetical protein M437DRAFT_63092 [Aureobasidium melanogenum CBS 110374]
MHKLPEHMFASYGTLSSSFVRALKRWKRQTISFLDLPGEIRNKIYSLLIPNTDGYYTELWDLSGREAMVLPPVVLMLTCRQVQRELTPLYLRTINLRFYNRDYDNMKKFGEPINEYHLRTMTMYERLDPSVADYLHSIRLTSTAVHCDIRVTDSKVVHVQLCTFGGWIKSSALTYMSIAVRNKIIDSLASSSTGLLGVRHLVIAVKELGQLQEWCEWRKQKADLTMTECGELPWQCWPGDDFWCYEYHADHLRREAEAESLPRLIPAVSFERPGQIWQRLLWKNDEERWRQRKRMEADGALSAQPWWLFEEHLVEEAEQEGMPRLIRAATPPPDEL